MSSSSRVAYFDIAKNSHKAREVINAARKVVSDFTEYQKNNSGAELASRVLIPLKGLEDLQDTMLYYDDPNGD